MESVTEKLRDIISRQLDVGIPLDAVTPDVPLMEEGLGLDSIAIVELVTLIEENFAVDLNEDDLEMEGFETLTTLTALVQSKLQVPA